MSLDLIVGPPNSGRSGAVLDRVRAELDRDPLLVVPTGDDIARFERDLCAGGTPSIGATIRTFASLFDEIATATAASVPIRLSPPQRLALVRAAVASTPTRTLSRSATAPGFAPALGSLITELQGALISPQDLKDAAASFDDSALELELAALYESYESLRDGAQRADEGSVANAAIASLRSEPEVWAGRPILVYGFDDLTEAQLALLRLLSERAAVTVAVNYADREALAARAGLLARLIEEGSEVGKDLPPVASYTRSASLLHVSSGLFEAAPGTVAPDGGIRLLDGGGERGEAETVGIEIARLLASGTDAQDVLVTLRNPSADGPLFNAVFRELGIPATLEAQLPLAGTAVGRSLLALCKAAAPDGEPADVLAHLRADTASPAGKADWAERDVARGKADSVADLVARWEDSTPPHLARVLEAEGEEEKVLSVAACARRIAEGAHREAAPLAGERSNLVPLDPIEMRAAVTAAELLEELAAVAGLPGCPEPTLADAAEPIESATVRSWQGSAEGRVRIVSPYRARAARVKHLFCCGMQEGVFPGRGVTDPLLGEESRARLGFAALKRREQELEERYLFCVCASRPTESLVLSWHSCDDEGHPAARSPFVDEVVDLIGDDPIATEERITLKRGLARSVPEPSEATSPRGLARALTAAVGRDVDRQREALDAAATDLAVTGDVLALTASSRDPAWRPGPLTHPAVIDAIASRESLSANSLEGWITCSYKWFVDHELSPRRLEPEADPLWLGGMVHASLHGLYAEPPGEDGIPRETDIARWKERFNELLDGLLAAEDSGYHGADRHLAIARVRIQIEAYLEDESQRETTLRPRPDLLERSFGFPETEGDPGALDLGDFTLRGAIDRIDVEPGGVRAVVRDYKTSKAVAGRAKIAEEGKLQLPLYMLVARDLLGLDPIAGIYHPLAAYNDRRGRGIASLEEAKAGLLEGEDIVSRGKVPDTVAADELPDVLEEARSTAIAYGQTMRAGRIERNPLGDTCPRYCTYQPICRLERALGLEEQTQEGGER